jgi:hypothetical protein
MRGLDSGRTTSRIAVLATNSGATDPGALFAVSAFRGLTQDDSDLIKGGGSPRRSKGFKTHNSAVAQPYPPVYGFKTKKLKGGWSLGIVPLN